MVLYRVTVGGLIVLCIGLAGTVIGAVVWYARSRMPFVASMKPPLPGEGMRPAEAQPEMGVSTTRQAMIFGLDDAGVPRQSPLAAGSIAAGRTLPEQQIRAGRQWRTVNSPLWVPEETGMGMQPQMQAPPAVPSRLVPVSHGLDEGGEEGSDYGSAQSASEYSTHSLSGSS